MTTKKHKPGIAPLIKRRQVLPRGWTLTTIAQWIPVASVAIGGLIWLTQLGDRVTALEKLSGALAGAVWHQPSKQ